MTEHDAKKGEAKKEHAPQNQKAMYSLKKLSLWKGMSAVLGVLLIISIYVGVQASKDDGSAFCLGIGICSGYGGSSAGNEAATVAKEPKAPANLQPTQPEPAPRVYLEAGDSPSKGNSDAPVTMIEFSDFQCSFCARFFSQTLSEIEKEYVNTGKVRFVYKHLPLVERHPQANPAALASECAREQGKFWEYHDLLLGNQNSLSESSYKAWAGQLNLEQVQFNECFDSKKYQGRVDRDAQQAAQAGIRGTPGFLINGILVSGALPFVNFTQVIDAELAG